MKSLKSILEASVLADIDDQLEIGDEAIKSAVERFIKENYISDKYIISDNINKYGKYEVSSTGSVFLLNTKITSLTNNMFVWCKVGKQFDCSGCISLKSLEGAPKEVGGNFECSGCHSLTTLKGAPEKVDGSFYCHNCDSLKSLEGAPKKVGVIFYCTNCKVQFTINDVKKVSNVKCKIYC